MTSAAKLKRPSNNVVEPLVRCADWYREHGPRAGPPPSFIARTRNPELEPPARFEPTLKREGDVIL